MAAAADGARLMEAGHGGAVGAGHSRVAADAWGPHWGQTSRMRNLCDVLAKSNPSMRIGRSTFPNVGGTRMIVEWQSCFQIVL